MSWPAGRLGGIHWERHLLALLLGAAGGAVAAWFRLPLAWMIGAMLATSLAAIGGLRIEVPKPLRGFMVMVLGIMLGSSFTPDVLDGMARWWMTLAALVLYIAACIAIGSWYLRRIVGLDPVTAYFTATPGGLNEMVAVGHALGGDDRVIALSHSVRIMIVVMTLPFLFRLLPDYQAPASGALGPGLLDVPPGDYLLLALAAVGAPIATRLRVPAAVLVGPMLISAAIHLAGLTSVRPPGPIIAIAQVVVGAYLGCRFAGISLSRLARLALNAAGLTAALLAVTVGFALALHAATGIGIPDLVLGYAPGGLAEMSLVALALGVDVAFVATHHIVRIILIVLFAPGAFLLLRRLKGRSGT